jgi:hypothetical protein
VASQISETPPGFSRCVTSTRGEDTNLENTIVVGLEALDAALTIHLIATAIAKAVMVRRRTVIHKVSERTLRLRRDRAAASSGAARSRG